MDSNLFSRRRAERFAQLLDEANGGRRHHVRSRVDDQLKELVTLGRHLTETTRPVEVDAGFRAELRARLVATAQREGLGATAGTETPGRRLIAGLTARGPLLPAVTARRARARGAILVGVAVGAVAVSGISTASENAVPGDALYGMKRSTERAQLALASSDLGRGQLLLDFAHTRLAEASAVRGDRTALAAILHDMDENTRQGVRLLTSAAMQRTEPAGLDAVDTFLTSQRQTMATLLDGATSVDQERIRRSLGLLDEVEQRTRALRAALACGAAPSGTADRLGPTAGPCPVTR